MCVSLQHGTLLKVHERTCFKGACRPYRKIPEPHLSHPSPRNAPLPHFAIASDYSD
ncbi:hypothetical protein C8R48DRAFT_725906 [Suillus tomentosus]|nr:hypothetical protein C8R48DRAFT_725906 [Suillus tomentosus]